MESNVNLALLHVPTVELVVSALIKTFISMVSVSQLVPCLFCLRSQVIVDYVFLHVRPQKCCMLMEPVTQHVLSHLHFLRCTISKYVIHLVQVRHCFLTKDALQLALIHYSIFYTVDHYTSANTLAKTTLLKSIINITKLVCQAVISRMSLEPTVHILPVSFHVQ